MIISVDIDSQIKIDVTEVHCRSVSSLLFILPNLVGHSQLLFGVYLVHLCIHG